MAFSKSPRGSSPLARGLREFASHGWGCRRFIPAPAGFAILSAKHGRTGKVHPRWCGVCGQPLPRPRGGNGFIPAGAGSAIRASGKARSRTVHPRRRGVFCGPEGPSRLALGSSPLARGLLDDARMPVDDLRFIPAGAGSATRSVSPCWAGGVHPRPRGVCPTTSRDERYK